MHWCSGTVHSDAVQASARARRVVDREALVLTNLRTAATLGRLLVLTRGPFAREIDLRGGGVAEPQAIATATASRAIVMDEPAPLGMTIERSFGAFAG